MDSRELNKIYNPKGGPPDSGSNWKDIKDSVDRHVAQQPPRLKT